MTRETLNVVREYILSGLARGAFTEGQKLPAERALAQKLGTTRATVRQALMLLEAEKRVTRHVGRGTFIASDGARQPAGTEHAYDEVTPTWPRIDASPAQLMQARQLIEPHIAELVVVNATEGDLGRIWAVVESQQELEADEFEQSDIDFHTLLARATHNELIIATAKLFNAVRQNPEWRRLKAAVRQRHGGRKGEAVREHRALSEALQARNAKEAQRTMRAHLNNVCVNLLGY